jgi:hypothetical protein
VIHCCTFQYRFASSGPAVIHYRTFQYRFADNGSVYESIYGGRVLLCQLWILLLWLFRHVSEYLHDNLFTQLTW